MAKAPKDKPPKPPKPDKPGKPPIEVAPPSEPRIVAGAVQFTGHGGIATEPLSTAIEQAMSDAVTKALADGVSINDSETILQYKQDARRRVLLNAAYAEDMNSRQWAPLDVAKAEMERDPVGAAEALEAWKRK